MKKSLKILFIFLGIILLLGIIIGIYFAFGIKQSVIQGGYSCPSDKICTVTPILKCTTEQINQKVILRTNSPNWNQESFGNTGTMIAFDSSGSGSLLGYVLSSTQSSCLKNSVGSINFFKDKNIGIDFIYSRSSDIWVCISDTTAKKYIKTTLIPTSQSPTEPYKTNNQEKYSGSLYSCSREIYINNVKKTTLIYSSNSPTPINGIKGDTYTLNGEDSISSQGNGEFSVDYTISDKPITTCIASNSQTLNIGESICINQLTLETCQQTSGNPVIITNNAVSPQICSNGKLIYPTTCKASNNQIINIGDKICIDQYTQEECIKQSGSLYPSIIKTMINRDIIPPQICKDGKIGDAYKVDIKLNKQVLSSTDKLEIDFSLTGTSNNKNIPITTQILKGSQVINTKTQSTGNNIMNEGTTDFIFDAPSTGYYTLKISFSHPEGDYSKEYNLQVTEELAVTFTTPNPIQFDINPIEISLNSYKSGSPKELTNFELDAVYNGIKQYQYTTENPSLGILKFKFPLRGDGILRVRSRGNDESGLWTDWTDYFEVTVKKSTILISTDFKTDECMGTLIQKFETKDSLGNYVESQNQITIDKPLGGTDSVSSTGSNGKYSFSYNFAEGGLYIVRITSSNSKIGSSQLNSGQGQIINILGGTSCNGGCEGISCYTTYIIIGVIILALGLFIYFVFFFRRK